MKFLIITLLLMSLNCFADLSKESCEAKIKAAITAGTGKTPDDSSLIVYICEGIIEEIKTNAVVETSTGTGTVK